jgi:dUTP pyrophosphatase
VGDTPDKITVEVVRLSHSGDLPLPSYQTQGSAGMDLRAAVGEPLTIPPGDWKLVPTGLSVAIPIGFEAQVRPRSGLALHNGLIVLNTPGTIDSDYRGEIGVILANLSRVAFTIERGMRIAQLVFSRITKVIWQEAKSLPPSVRGDGGFGHTGS